MQQRLNNQHLATPDFATPADVVRWFGAVQAQDYLSALYAIGLRMPDATEQIVEQAVADRTIVRSWPMRGTIHFMPPEDARWMLKLLAPRQMKKLATVYRKAGLTDNVVARAGDVFAKSLQGGKQLPRKALYAALQQAEIASVDEQRGMFMLGYWAMQGLLCLGPRLGKQHTVVLLDEWIPKAPLLEGDAALASLARRYFSSHGPATAYDFAWWTGLTITEARRSLKLVEADLVQQNVDGQTYWSGPITPPTSRGGADAYLLPPYDEFTVAYKDRSAYLDPAFLKEALYGIGPTIIINARMVGTWKRTLKKDAVLIKCSLFAPLNKDQQAALGSAVTRYGKFLGLPAIIDS